MREERDKKNIGTKLDFLFFNLNIYFFCDIDWI